MTGYSGASADLQDDSVGVRDPAGELQQAAGGAAAKFQDNGGAVIQIPRVMLLYWGSAWTATSPPPSPTSLAVTNAVGAMLRSAYMTGLAEYREIGRGHLIASAVYKQSNPPNGFTDSNVSTFVKARIADGTVPAVDDFNQNLYVVVMPQGVNSSNTSFVGEHTYFTDGSQRVRFAWITNNGTLDSITSIISHEIVEAATDPEGSAILGVAGTCSQSGWCEVADICSSTQRRNGVAVQSFWSDASSACVVPDWPARTFPQTGVQFRGTVPANARKRWFTFRWPEYLHIRWRVIPVTAVPGAPQVSWRTQIERASGAYLTYWITVQNLTDRDIGIEGRYTILGICQ